MNEKWWLESSELQKFQVTFTVQCLAEFSLELQFWHREGLPFMIHATTQNMESKKYMVRSFFL